MEFRIVDTFTASLARLNGAEQKAVKTTAFDLQINPASPGMSFHKLARSRDKSFWSVRVGSEIRLIVHRTGDSLLLCFAGHHNAAYTWAERRRIERHPVTGAAQLVELPERAEAAAPAPMPGRPRHGNRRCSITSRTRHYSPVAFRLNGSPRCAVSTRTASSTSPSICPKRRPRCC